MSLQSRLFTFFILIVVVPIGIFALVGQRIIVRELERRTYGQLIPAQQAAVAVYESRRSAARDRVQLIASSEDFGRMLLEKNYGALQAYVLDRLGQGANQIDYLVVTEPQGTILVAALTDPNFTPAVPPPTPEEIVGGNDESGDVRRFMVTRSIVPIRSDGQDVAVVVGGYYLDNDFVGALSEGTDVDASLLLSGQIYSSTLDEAGSSRIPLVVDLTNNESDVFLRLSIGENSIYAVPQGLQEGVPATEAALLMSIPQDPVLALSGQIRTAMIVLLVLATLGSALLGFSLARLISRPLRELAAAANAITAGDYNQHIEVRSRDEVGQLGRAFNQMTDRLVVHIAELKESREELKRALTRFAETLRSTHDLDRLLAQVIDASVDTLRAERGLLMWMNTSRDSLITNVNRGFEELDEFIVPLGEGVAGAVAASSEAIRLPEDGAMIRLFAKEPTFRTCLAVPIFSEQRVIAVLSLYDKEDGQNFTEADMGTLLSLADQAGVAVENVLLHQETKRQAIMDPVTGVWNYRYFQLRYAQELERSARFHRPFTLCLIDIDDFKNVNDTYGHQRGDSVLIELARRVNAAIRDIDSLARYGGEEFVLILPETDVEGGRRTAEKIRAAIADAPFDGDPPANVTISVGIATYPVHGKDKDELYNNADIAMYAAKRAGKNRVMIYKEPVLNT